MIDSNATKIRLTLGIYAHVIGNQQRDAVETRSARIEQFAVN
jgi:hypothetical protein